MPSRAEQRERSHEAIVASAAALLRTRGIDGTSVAEVMAGAGLTVGGFYAHFDDKEALVRAGLRRCALELRARLFGGFDDADTDRRADKRLDTALRRYLSPQHRDDPAAGCALPAVVGEVGTTSPSYGGVVAEQLEAMVAALSEVVPSSSSSSSSSSSKLSKRTVALATVAMMYGGLSLARAVRGAPLSDEILKACRAAAARS
ncbi:MAG TPA: TetR/AcrR family transcriptional regulator [Myxococcota bacterium]